MNLIFTPYQEKNKCTWDEFVLKHSLNGTIFHTQKFISYHPKNKFIDCSLLIFEEEKNELLAVILIAEKDGFFFSHPGTSGGGWVFKKNLNQNTIFYIIDKTLETLDYNLSFRLQENVINNGFSKQLAYYLTDKYQIEEDICVALQKDSVNQTISKRILQGIKSLENKNNFKIKELSTENELILFYKMVENNLKTYQSVPTHSLKEFLSLTRILEERSLVFASFLDNEITSGIWIIQANNEVWHTQYLAKNYELKLQYDQHILIKFTEKLLFNKGVNVLNLGSCKGGISKQFSKGIHHFKMSLGGIETKRYVLKPTKFVS